MIYRISRDLSREMSGSEEGKVNGAAARLHNGGVSEPFNGIHGIMVI